MPQCVIEDIRRIHEYDTTSGDRSDLFDRIFPDLKCGKTLTFRLRPTLDCCHTPQRLVGLLHQKIFAAASLCLPASCKCHKITYLGSENVPPPTIYGFYFEDFARFTRDDGRPKYRDIPFANAWNWLMACGKFPRRYLRLLSKFPRSDLGLIKVP